MIPASLHACGVVFPFATATSICRNTVTICSGLYFCIGIYIALLHDLTGSICTSGSERKFHEGGKLVMSIKSELTFGLPEMEIYIHIRMEAKRKAVQSLIQNPPVSHEKALEARPN